MASNIPDHLLSPISPGIIEEGIRGGIWEKLLFFESVDSTNERGLALSATELPARGAVLIADSQTKGRGRRGRSWVSPPLRNIYLSAILAPATLPYAAPLTLLAAVSAASGLRRTTGLDVRIKWPNDLLVNGRKIGGILSELRSGPGRAGRPVIGIGINVNIEERDFPGEVRGIATSVRAETGKVASRDEIIIEVLRQMESWYRRLIEEGTMPVLKEWNRLTSTIGKKVRVDLGREVVSGIAEALDAEGRLIVRPESGSPRTISAGDVTELR